MALSRTQHRDKAAGYGLKRDISIIALVDSSARMKLCQTPLLDVTHSLSDCRYIRVADYLDSF